MTTKWIRNFALALPLCGLSACQDDVPAPKRVADARGVVELKPTPPVPTPPPTPTASKPTVPESKKVERAVPKTGPEMLKEARRLLDEGENESALPMARRAAQKLPESFLAWNTLGRAELEMNHGKEAQEAFSKALEISPESSYAHNNMGLTYIYEEKWDQALDELEKATTLTPVKAFMWNNLGVVLEHLDRLDEARAAYQKAADGGADNAKASVARLEGVKTIKTAKVESKVESKQPAQPEKVKVDENLKK